MQTSYPPHSLQRKSSLGEDPTVHQSVINPEDELMDDQSIADPALNLIIADDGSMGDESMDS